MKLTRRGMLGMGGGMIAALALTPTIARAIARAEDIVEIEMGGRSDGSHVWFDPIGLRINRGRTIRWTNRDPGNSHTATAYRPRLFSSGGMRGALSQYESERRFVV